MSKSDSRIEPRKLKGFRDYPPAIMHKRYEIMDVIRKEARLAGFQVLGTPALEYEEILLGQGSEETDKQVYRFEDHGGRRVGLRFDLTIPFARYVAEHQGQMTFPFKRLQIGDVWRGEKNQKGRYREFAQCDFDIIGVNSVAADVEVIQCLIGALERLDFGAFTMRLGNRLLLSAMIRKVLGEVDADGEVKALIALDKLDKIGADAVIGLLKDVPGAKSDGAVALLKLLTQKTEEGHSDLIAIGKSLAGDEGALTQLTRLQETLAILNSLSLGKNPKIIIDISIARGLGYYTGIVFETTVDALPGFGSISSGGRYDQLVSRFSSRNLEGVGGSIGLDRLVAALEELQKVGKEPSPQVFVAIATDDAKAYAFEIAQILRRENISCDIALTTGKVGNQFKHADRLGCPLVVTVGSDEMKSKTFALKQMQTGVERRGVPLADLQKVIISV